MAVPAIALTEEPRIQVLLRLLHGILVGLGSKCLTACATAGRAVQRALVTIDSLAIVEI